jgi:hypothetical protein
MNVIPSYHSTFILPRDPAEILREREEIGKAARKIRRTPATAKAFLIKHGFITKSGEIAKRYR